MLINYIELWLFSPPGKPRGVPSHGDSCSEEGKSQGLAPMSCFRSCHCLGSCDGNQEEEPGEGSPLEIALQRVKGAYVSTDE